jgi:bacterial leucyl aminopeptidase
MFCQLIPLLLLTVPAVVSACQSSITKPPLLWLADLRSGSTHIDSDSTPSLVEAPGHRLVRFEQGATPIPVSMAEKLELEKSGLRYFDVTEVDVESVFRERIISDRSAVATKPSEWCRG